MKQTLVLFSAVLFALFAIVTFGIANASPTPHFAPADTATATPTVTETVTATLTPTTNPCVGHPAAPILVGPPDKAKLTGGNVTLRWQAVECATKYRVVVRRSSKPAGPLAYITKTKKTRVVTSALALGYTYYWYVKACNQNLCGKSVWFSFILPPPPTPKPTTPAPTSPAGTPPPGGTPVAGNPPPQVKNYHDPSKGGPGVYLNTDPNDLLPFRCNLGWVQFQQGKNVYVIPLWFDANEQVTLTIINFNLGQETQTVNLAANSQGYLEYVVDDSSWTPDHYHLLFDGKTSKVEYCGHFDVDPAPNVAGVEHSPHTAAELQQFQQRLDAFEATPTPSTGIEP